MGLLDLIPKDLLSRKVRANASHGKTGRELITGGEDKSKSIRKIGSLTKLESAQDKGFIGWLWNTGDKFKNWLFSIAGRFISWSFTSFVSWLFQTAMELWQFNWNASDEELKASIEGQRVAMMAIWGSVVGQGLGWFTGIAIGYGVALVLPVIGGAAFARLVAAKAAEEGMEEVGGAIIGAIMATATMWHKAQQINHYMNLRHKIKSLGKDRLSLIFGPKIGKFLAEDWGKKGGPEYSCSKGMDKVIESIPDKGWRAFASSLVEDYWDSFMEAGFVVANQIDMGYAQAKQANRAAKGPTRSVEITLDAQAKGANQEKLKILSLPQAEMIAQVEQTVNVARVVHNRDMGLVMGMPLDEYVRAKPQSLRLVLDMYSHESPPYWRHEDLIHATITIPDVKRSALDWDVIKRAVGGKNGYMWGRFKATARLDTGRKILLFAGTEQEAEERVNALLTLTTASLVTLSVTEEKKAGERLKKPKLQKNITKIYPGFFTVINREELLDPTIGQATTRSNNFRDKRGRFALWPEKEPSNVKDGIAQILVKGY